MYHATVNRGYVCYVRGGNVVKEIEIGAKERVEVAAMIEDILAIVQRGRFPKRTPYAVRCLDCCYRNICVK
jgi:CRISPR-associated exonuclease Cas4